MNAIQLPKLLLGAMLVLALHTASAHAQMRTWVSRTGDDAGGCSYAFPCKSLGVAVSKTLAGGEVSLMDANPIGGALINKSLTINGEGTLGSIMVSSGSGIVVNAAPTDKVIIRNISFLGVPGGNVGINVHSGNVTIDKCFMYGFVSGPFGGAGVNVSTTNGAKVDIRDTNITNSSFGVLMSNTAGYLIATLDNVRINDVPGYGIGTSGNNVYATVNNAFISSAGVAVYGGAANSNINVDNSRLTNSQTAVNAANATATIRLNNNGIYNNTTAYVITGGATVATANNNTTSGNGGGVVPNGTVVIQ